jgi:4-amino-4-deoxy-L-arabinose transferase-like glycosyltransferase
MALGGFNGSDAPLTLAQFKQLVKEGKVRYYITSTSGMGGGGNSEISSWAKSAGAVINYGGSQYTVYDLSSAQ